MVTTLSAPRNTPAKNISAPMVKFPSHSRPPPADACTPCMDDTTIIRLWMAVSLVGSPVAMTALAFLVVGVLAAQRRRLMAVGGIVAQGGGAIINETLKQLIHRPRPLGAQPYLYGHSWSFPSGHAMGSLIGFGFLGYVIVACWSVKRRTHVLAIALAAALTLAVGLSRLALGVHYVSDVLGGWAIGATWLLGCILVLQRAARAEQHGSATA